MRKFSMYLIAGLFIGMSSVMAQTQPPQNVEPQLNAMLAKASSVLISFHDSLIATVNANQALDTSLKALTKDHEDLKVNHEALVKEKDALIKERDDLRTQLKAQNAQRH